MQASIEQISQVSVLAGLETLDKFKLQPYTQIRQYCQGEIVFHEGDRLLAKLYALIDGELRVTKIATTGKETILRTLTLGEIFAAPALLGDGIAPATVTAETNCQILTVERDALLTTIQQNPDIALKMLMVFNSRLQQLHETVHGLVSERAIVRLARLIHYSAVEYGTQTTKDGEFLRVKLPYYRIARSIGITYEECLRLIKSLSCLVYHRGGRIAVLDMEKLEAIARGELAVIE
ncbi:Crp/Fnr family transcriptional regulator [Gloeocapsopsis crepidinum LEGE 06123]|uniref:Crp/Fnr family transcriptional regulator n=1 Tax=Gloeocapsopsis crepidinum LEGE 06123 TaxID=588587 RepID=A0ABR9ULM5_9CHRO|nr:Crp/Fnr family transcriptional regulator [Gloeocapsopsis crepidinum]MBE9189187.1 Crp/Fnr family transcriptional regulator [Gloeocapsopsis crepidinum LEGE 06123]